MTHAGLSLPRVLRRELFCPELCIVFALGSPFRLNLHEGPPFAFQSNKELYQAYSSCLADLSSPQTAQPRVKFTQAKYYTHARIPG